VPTADSPRERLLAAAIEHLAQDGSHDLSLRSIAAAIGTSHRMLNYHFGSRNGPLAAIVSELERRQRAFMATVLLDREATPGELVWRMWEQVADERLWPYERLFFEMSGRALRGEPDAQALRSELVDPWLVSVDALSERAALTPAQARAEARLAIAVTRVVHRSPATSEAQRAIRNHSSDRRAHRCRLGGARRRAALAGVDRVDAGRTLAR
jgi:AcrR family transcriptional regulator